MAVSVASVSSRQRVAAVIALVAVVATVVLAVVTAITDFPQGLGVLGCVAIALGAAWFGVIRGGRQRTVGIAVALLALVGAAVLLTRNGSWLSLALLVVGIAIGHAAARAAFQPHVHLPAAERPQRPVLFINPWSGGGKAAKVGLAAEASARGIKTVELRRGDDLEQLVRGAVEAGADGLAAAGGDGTQAIVATAAAEHGLPYACIPAGTRNHFALDLGVDRDDVVGALDAFVDGGEHLVDLGEVNGRVFVNNVSMGLYAEAVQSEGYRDAKIRTLLDTAPTVLGSTGSRLDLRWTSPDGVAHASAATILVSNNAYRLGRAVGSGTRPRIDTGQLGVAVVPARGDDGAARPRVVVVAATMVDLCVPGRLRTTRPAGYRRRSRRTRPSNPLPDPPPRTARSDRPTAPRGVAIGDAARPHRRRHSRTGGNRRRPGSDDQRAASTRGPRRSTRESRSELAA